MNPLLDLVLAERDRVGGLPGEVTDEARAAPLIDAPVVIGVRSPRQFIATLTARTDETEATLHAFADIAMRESDSPRAVVLRCRASDLTVALITLLDPEAKIHEPGDVPPPVLVWKLASRSADATARADVLDFLYALHQGAVLEILDSDRSVPIGSMEAPGGPFDPDLARDRHFLNDVATLEEWSGMSLPVPPEVPANEVARIHQAAEMVRSRRVPVKFTGDIQATVDSSATSADELYLEQELGVSVFGFDVPLGLGRARFPVEVVETEPASEAGLTSATFRPDVSGRPILFALEPPAERTPYKRTLGPDEAPSPEVDDVPTAWLEGEREAEDELRANRGIRFATEEAFFSWLTQADGATGV